jgi:hypothetical protein
MQPAPLRAGSAAAPMRRLRRQERPLRERNSGKASSAAEVVPFDLGAGRELGSQKNRQ